MRRIQFLRLTGLLMLLALIAPAQTESDKIRQLAEESTQLLITSEFSKFADSTHPKLVALLGGKSKMVALLEKGMQEMKSQGFEFASAVIGEPGPVINVNKQRFAIVPYVLTMKAPKGSIATDSFLLAVADGPVAHWTFVDGRNLDQAKLKTLFPDAVGKIELPKLKPPEVKYN